MKNNSVNLLSKISKPGLNKNNNINPESMGHSVRELSHLNNEFDDGSRA